MMFVQHVTTDSSSTLTDSVLRWVPFAEHLIMQQEHVLPVTQAMRFQGITAWRPEAETPTARPSAQIHRMCADNVILDSWWSMAPVRPRTPCAEQWMLAQEPVPPAGKAMCCQARTVPCSNKALLLQIPTAWSTATRYASNVPMVSTSIGERMCVNKWILCAEPMIVTLECALLATLGTHWPMGSAVLCKPPRFPTAMLWTVLEHVWNVFPGTMSPMEDVRQFPSYAPATTNKQVNVFHVFHSISFKMENVFTQAYMMRIVQGTRALSARNAGLLIICSHLPAIQWILNVSLSTMPQTCVRDAAMAECPKDLNVSEMIYFDFNLFLYSHLLSVSLNLLLCLYPYCY